jgi:hypothetical protein
MRAFLALALLAAGCTVQGDGSCGVHPSARDGATAVFVPTSNEVYLYGGVTATSGDAGDLWRYSFVGNCNGGWTPLATATHPSGIGAPYAAAFDSQRHRIVYVGFAGPNVWALDTDSLTWTQLMPTLGPDLHMATFPRPTAAVYDAEHDRLLVGPLQLRFSGSDQGQWEPLPVGSNHTVQPTLTAASALDPVRRAVYALDDAGALTVYNLLTDTQSAVTLAGDAIGSGAGARMAFDTQNQRMVVLAPGAVFSFEATNGDGTTATVTHLAPSGTAPPTRGNAAFALSGPLGLVFGGITPVACRLDDTWYLVDEKQWQTRAVATTCR